MIRQRAFLVLLMVGIVSLAAASELVVESDQSGYVLVNTSSFPLLGIRVGQRTLSELAAGARISLSGETSQPSGGRYRLSDWQEALQTVTKLNAPNHELTAGLTPDAIQPGMAGAPIQSENIRALMGWRGEPFRCPEEGGDSCIRLVSYASRYLPIAQLESLLERIQPDPPPSPTKDLTGGEFGTLKNLREAFELQGASRLAQVDIPVAWLVDRGIDTAALVSILGLRLPKKMSKTDVVDTETTISEILNAYGQGAELKAARFAVMLAADSEAMRRLSPEHNRLVCSGFDAGAAVHMKQERYLAAYGYMKVMSQYCPQTPAQASRMADWFSLQGREAFANLRLEAARALFEHARFFDQGPKTDAQLADTCAELAILRFREGHIVAGRRHLSRAKEVSSLRPKVLAAIDADPGVNERAKVAVLIVIGVLSFFVIRKLRRVWFGRLTNYRR